MVIGLERGVAMKNIIVALVLVVGGVFVMSNKTIAASNDKFPDEIKINTNSVKPYYIMKRSDVSDKPSPVVLVFGYGDNQMECSFILEAMKDRMRGFPPNYLFCDSATGDVEKY